MGGWGPTFLKSRGSVAAPVFPFPVLRVSWNVRRRRRAGGGAGAGGESGGVPRTRPRRSPMTRREVGPRGGVSREGQQAPPTVPPRPAGSRAFRQPSVRLSRLRLAAASLPLSRLLRKPSWGRFNFLPLTSVLSSCSPTNRESSKTRFQRMPWDFPPLQVPSPVILNLGRWTCGRRLR